MKTAFQAKDIQEILRIPKIRYEYLARKISIVPEIEEGEGTGKAHKFSFKNLMEFAISERCSLNGLSMRQIKFLLEIVKKHADPNIFQPEPQFNITTGPENWSEELMTQWSEHNKANEIKFDVWFTGHPGGGLFFWEGKDADVCYFGNPIKKLNLKNTAESLGYYFIKMKFESIPDHIEQLRRAIKIDTEHNSLNRVLESFDAAIHINVGNIRRSLSASVTFHKQMIKG